MKFPHDEFEVLINTFLVSAVKYGKLLEQTVVSNPGAILCIKI